MSSKGEMKIVKSLKNDYNPKSRAVRVRILLKKNQGLIRDKQAMTEFKEPILMLMRRSNAVEFYEDASKGEFDFKHSDGKKRTIYLEPSSQKSFDYGKRKFRGYICHEDYPLPLPEQPLVTADTVNLIVEKSMMDSNKLKNRMEMLKTKQIMWIALGIAILLIIWMAYKQQWIPGLLDSLFGTHLVQHPAQAIQNVTDISNKVATNSLSVTSGG